MLKNSGQGKTGIQSSKTVALDLILPRIPLILTAYLFYKFVKFQVLFGLGKLTNDSASFLYTALQYAKHADNIFPPDRELGYRTFILLISWITPWETPEELAFYVTLVQTALYLLLGLAWTIASYRLLGPWPTVLVPLLFALDHFDSRWLAYVMSEAPAKMLSLTALLLFMIGVVRQKYFPVLGAIVLIGLIPIFRTADIAIPLATIAGILTWWLFSRGWRNLATALLFIAVIVGPQLTVQQYNYWKWGLYGSTVRGGHMYLAGRFLALADPEKVRESGVSNEIVDKIFLPYYNAWNPFAGYRGWHIEGSPRIYFPWSRDRDLIAAGNPEVGVLIQNYLQAKGRPADLYAISTFSQKLARIALWADPVPIIRSVLLIMWDYVRFPFYWGEGYLKRNRALPVIWFFLIFLFIWRWRKKSPRAIGSFITGLTLMPFLWAIAASYTGAYGPRYAYHLFLQTGLALLVANFLPSRKDSLPQTLNLD
jgi:hypothetical protein